MSFLVPLDEHEANATLADALAFIDAFESENVASHTPLVHSPAPSRRKSRGVRPKSEIERLRQQVDKLEAALEQLKHTDSQTELLTKRYSSPCAVSQVDDAAMSIVGCALPQSKWMEILVQEHRRRRQAEVTNCQLKVLLAKQIQMIQSSQAAFAYMFTEADMSLLYNSQQAMAPQHATMYDALVVDSLAHRIERLKLDKDNVIQSSGLANASWSLSRTVRNVDPRFGLYLETSSCLPIRCSMEHADKLIWQSLRFKLMQSQDPNIEIPEGHTKTQIHEHERHTYRLVTRMTLHRQIESDQIVYYWSSISPVICKGLRFIEDQMVIIKRAPAADSPEPTKPTTLLQSWIRVAAEPINPSQSCFNIGMNDPDSFKDALMDKLSKRLSNYLTSLANTLEVF